MKKHTKTIILVIVGAAILIGGIWGVNESRYPNAPAFDDHFTRKFLNRDKKVDDGFYEFKSKTGQYTMCGFQRSIKCYMMLQSITL